MNKKDEETQEVPEETQESEEPKVEQKPVMLGQLPTDYQTVFQTPDGVFTQEEYLVWMGNQIVGIKEALVGNQ